MSNPEGGDRPKITSKPPKKGGRSVTLSYSNVRIRLDTIASYWPYYDDSGGSRGTKYGIEFVTRSGENIRAYGDHKGLRNKALKWLDDKFQTERFLSSKCSICVNPEANKKDPNCGIQCYSYKDYNKFVEPSN